VTSTDGNLLPVLFADPPYAPLPPGDQGNKIVWAAKDPPGGGLTVDAHLVGTPEAVEIGEIFLGRSLVNVPKPGCWRLTLHWTLQPLHQPRDRRHRLQAALTASVARGRGQERGVLRLVFRRAQLNVPIC
jgi:hypothetical protein